VEQRSLPSTVEGPLLPAGSAPRGGDALTRIRLGSVALAVFLGTLSILILTLAASVLLLLFQLTHASATLAGSAGDAIQSAGQAVARDAASAAQSVSDATDPFHPPRYPIKQDPQFDDLTVLAAGSPLGDSRLYHFDVAAIEQRPEATEPSQNVYARIHRQLIVPQVTKVLGITVRTSDDAKDYALYPGQEFSLAGHTYKVNWLSVETQQVALARFRRSEDAGGPLVFVED
jgi:hypothetical protein